MTDTNQIRSVFEDNGYMTVDDSDSSALFLAKYPEAMESGSWTPDLPDICAFFEIDYRRINSDFVAILSLNN